MNYVLLGESETLPLLLKAIGNSDSKLIGAALCGSMKDQVLSTNPGARLVSQWEDLLSLNEIDAVIVAGAAENVLVAAKQFATEERPLIIIPDVGMRSVFTYELSLIRDDSDVKLIPAFVSRSHPAIIQLKQQVDANTLGKTLQLRFDRTVEHPDARPKVFSIPEIDAQLLADADLLRIFGAEYNQVTSIRTGRTEDGASTATVTLAGEFGGVPFPEAAWTLNSGPQAGWSMTIIGETGQSTVSGTGLFDVRIDDKPVDCDEMQLGKLWLTDLESALSSPVIPTSTSETATSENRTTAVGSRTASLTECSRAFEIVDGSHESIRRRRTIDLYFETTSERNLFKTQMAAMGCLVLTWTLFGMVGFLIAGTLISGPSGDVLPGADGGSTELSTFEYWVWHVLRVLWIAPIVIFSIAQVLLVLARPAKNVDQTQS